MIIRDKEGICEEKKTQSNVSHSEHFVRNTCQSFLFMFPLIFVMDLITT